MYVFTFIDDRTSKQNLLHKYKKSVGHTLEYINALISNENNIYDW